MSEQEWEWANRCEKWKLGMREGERKRQMEQLHNVSFAGMCVGEKSCWCVCLRVCASLCVLIHPSV